MTEPTPNEMDFPRDWQRENRGIKPIFFLDRQSIKDDSGHVTGEIDVECVKLLIAGDDLTRPILPVDDVIRERFAGAYEAFKADLEHKPAGTKLSAWPELPEDVAKIFSEYDIETVEDLSALADANLHIMLGARRWRDKAVAFLKDSPSRERIDKVEAENERLREQLKRLEARFRKPARRKAPSKPRQPAPTAAVAAVPSVASVGPVTATGDA